MSLFPIDFKTLTDKERHNYILQTYILNKQSSAVNQRHKRDVDIIREHHRFLWEDDDDAQTATEQSWEQRLARRYYDKLFKEYCIADLTRHRDNKVALRWRTEAEVVTGVGQFQCGSRKCAINEELRSWEVNFAYQEQGERKNALVKLRLCPEHSAQLNYTTKKREVKRMKQCQKDERRQARKLKRAAKRQRKGEKKQRRPSKSDSQESDATPSGSDVKDLNNAIDYDDDESTETAETSEATEAPVAAADEDIWRKKIEVTEETVTRESEFERYLEDLLL